MLRSEAVAVRLQRLRWVVGRLSRMSAPEIAHRAREQYRRYTDRRQIASWSRFGSFRKEFRPIRDLQAPVPADGLRLAVEASAAAVREHRYELLNQIWPPSRETLWLLDPVTGSYWTGAGTPGSRVGYRHEQAKGDVKFVWELNRLQILQPLALARGDSAGAEIASVLASWMQENPPYDGINWTNGIEAASRLVSVLVARSASGGKTGYDEKSLCAFVEAHVAFLERYPSLFSSANNHRIAELAAVFVATVCMPDLPRAEILRTHARQALECEVLRQFFADGIGAEQSPTYSAYSLEWFTLAGIVGDDAGTPFSDEFRTRIGLSADALLWFCDDEGVAPELGDNDAGRVLSLAASPERRYCASVVNLVGRWLGRRDLLLPSDPDVRDLLRAESAFSPPATKPYGTRTFRDGGWTVFREDLEVGTLVLAFDHAPLGFLSIAAHGHADALSLTLSVGAEPVLIDPGTYLYHGGRERRDTFRSTAVHNTVTIEGANQSTIAGPFNWRLHAKTDLLCATTDEVEAAHDGYVERFGVTHTRQVHRASPRQFRIVDSVRRQRPGPALAWAMGFALHPAVSVELDGADALFTTGCGVRLTMSASASWSLADVEVSPSFNVKHRAKRLQLQGTAMEGIFSEVTLRVE